MDLTLGVVFLYSQMLNNLTGNTATLQRLEILRFITVIESLMLMISIHKDYENMREISDVCVRPFLLV